MSNRGGQGKHTVGGAQPLNGKGRQPHQGLSQRPSDRFGKTLPEKRAGALELRHFLCLDDASAGAHRIMPARATVGRRGWARPSTTYPHQLLARIELLFFVIWARNSPMMPFLLAEPSQALDFLIVAWWKALRRRMP